MKLQGSKVKRIRSYLVSRMSRQEHLWLAFAVQSFDWRCSYVPQLYVVIKNRLELNCNELIGLESHLIELSCAYTVLFCQTYFDILFVRMVTGVSHPRRVANLAIATLAERMTTSAIL